MAQKMAKQHSTATRPVQTWDRNVRKTPMDHPRTVRPDDVSVITSSYGGKLVPLKMIPLHREDGVMQSRIRVNVQMSETASMLLNPVRVSVAAYVVPKLAFDRFTDMGSIDRSWNGQPEIDDSVIPWFMPDQAGDPELSEFYKVLGLHGADRSQFNTDYLEAYNAVWNYIASERSPSLQLRQSFDDTLAPAFWQHTQMRHVKPSFDAAMMDGEVAIRTETGVLRAPVSGIGMEAGGDYNVPPEIGVKETGGSARDYASGAFASNQNDRHIFEEDPNNPGYPNIYAELSEAFGGFTFSVADIDQARKTSVWARMRNQYQGLSEEWMIDQMLSGIRLRDEELRHPFIVSSRENVIGMSQRYATDSGNLDKSLTDGRTAVDLDLRSPALPCGGVMVVVGQALPEQVYERQRDYYLNAQEVSEMPNRTRDELDPQPVSLVTKGEVDESHSLSDDLFGYAPLNHQWVRQAPNVGGRYYRPDPSAGWTEDRNRIWSADVVDPELGPDFYLSSTLSHEVFADQNTDPFEWWVSGRVNIQGLTFFGPPLQESVGDYDAIMAQIDQSRLKGDGSDVPNGQEGANE